MQLDFVLAKAVSGDIQRAPGCRHVFVWVVLSALPVLARVVRMGPGGSRGAGDGSAA